MLGIEKTIDFYKQLGKETSLFKLGIKDNELEQMANHICQFGTIGDIEKLDSKDILQILRMANRKNE